MYSDLINAVCNYYIKYIFTQKGSINFPYYLIFEHFLALKEAQDINLHLNPLRNFLDEFEQAEFEECHKFIQPLFHVVCLIWANSKYYRMPGRIVVLLQEICNLMINMVRNLFKTISFHKSRSNISLFL